MLILGFLFAGTLLNLSLGFLVQFKTYRKELRVLLLVLGGLFSVHLWVGYFSVSAFSSGSWFAYQRALQGLGLLIGLGCLELTRHFLRGRDENTGWILGGRRITATMAAIAGVALGELALFLSGHLVSAGTAGSPTLVFSGFAVLVPAVQVLLAIYILYMLEGTYRFAADYQRRIARLCFIGLGSMAVFHVFYYSRVLLYRELPEHYAEASSVVYGILYPVVLAGFLRYRLGSELITVPRDTVYTSATVFLTGASFLGVALTIIAFRWLRIDFSFFERFLVAFSLCFLAVLVLGSGTMRRHISRWVNRQFYSRKYDYQEQFFLLHKTSMSGADVNGALTELVENMKYSVTVDDAYFFVLNWQDGNFYQHENKEEASRRGLIINGDSPLARALARDQEPVDLLVNDVAGMARRQIARQEPLVDQLGVDAVFPVFMGDRLAGILALIGGRKQMFDSEDLDLIAVFTDSIGDALFKNRMLKERIEQKQFESFHHIASFIIHDIKNQVATLSLLLKNAERNIGNPSFQTSMLSSVKSCSTSLQSLIDRLSVAPKSQASNITMSPLRALLEEVIANAGLASLPGVDHELKGEGQDEAPMDRQSLFFVVRNLINNSLEAGKAGTGIRLTLSFGVLGRSTPVILKDLFGGGERFFASYGAYILVEDNGAGMDKEFVERRLFQPFATTKEKGVGIGLYQCKTLVEKMGGRILCHSELGKGTEFCILLPAAPPPGES